MTEEVKVLDNSIESANQLTGDELELLHKAVEEINAKNVKTNDDKPEELDYKLHYKALYKTYGKTVSELTLLTSLIKPLLTNKELMETVPFPQRAALFSYFNVDITDDGGKTSNE